MKSTAIDRANLSVCLQVASGGDAEERGRLAADGEGMSGDKCRSCALHGVAFLEKMLLLACSSISISISISSRSSSRAKQRSHTHTRCMQRRQLGGGEGVDDIYKHISSNDCRTDSPLG